MAPDRPQMAPEAPIWWEMTKNESRTPFQYKRVAPASLGPKNIFAKKIWGPDGAGAFSPLLIFLYMSVTPLAKNGGPGALRPQSALIFPKHAILGHFWPKSGPGGAG